VFTAAIAHSRLCALARTRSACAHYKGRMTEVKQTQRGTSPDQARLEVEADNIGLNCTRWSATTWLFEERVLQRSTFKILKLE
jgi:hypothetical protein